MNFEEINKKKSKIRNFSIIAHIDHGKSTLADRILEMTNTIEKRSMKSQYLDSMALERERGITIKLNSVEIIYKSKNQIEYIMHLIDTPGHVDFNYEVSRSLAACEGVLLIVDSTQGIQAQTLSNVNLALENNLTIIPILNKIDLPYADVEKTKKEMKDILGLDPDSIILASGKTGFGVDKILENIIEKINPPDGDVQAPLQALIFDSIFDTYKGVIPSIRIMNGILKKGDKIRFIASRAIYEVMEVGIFNPKPTKRNFLSVGDVGYLSAFIKNIDDVQVGDTITLSRNNAVLPLPGYRKVNPVVFCGLYPVDSSKYSSLKSALQKLKLNDSSLSYEIESSNFLGLGFRIGFLGLLHMEITKERIVREFNIEVIITAPSVIFHVFTAHKKIIIDNLSKWPKNQSIEKIEEPYIRSFIKCPEIYVGDVMEIAQNKRGRLQDIQYLDNQKVMLKYLLPFSEVIYNFFDKLKSATKGYASFDYEMDKYYPSKLKKVDILLNSEIVDALSFIVYEDFAFNKAKNICQKLKELIPQQMFEIIIQAAIGKKVITRETIKSLRKNVIDKCYGGDVSRKKKLLAKQKKGKKKMKNLGKVILPQKAFLAILSSYEK
ncbi:GTP-binding protein LepA [Candidatus Phytoplasma oryzae]|uniref:Elongation factor 4 n=1 Tax=Candidatus Phytoplasma oryzae TaxID=203274 RepID=A0A139JQX5_9MOLU|nr:translation elongation factor 4 [Candidatus Phytoplasma oryzae]KXT29244.1 GTP-binding protein LepA [Candidatus Phytoplasma oryzae]KXT29352.1 GTP-binding protein LepA [Candidatus Phytoplasma oryzae]RAM57904.1 GTP-binding protein LepA [Candidatus Phytoplasma oryzae]